MQITEISSLQNPRVKHLVKLRKRSVREEEQVFVIEGFRECQRATESGWPIESLYFCPDLFLGENEMDLLQEAEKRGAELFSCSPTVFKKIAYRDRPDGLLALAPQHHLTLSELAELKNPFLLVLVGIEKPGNLGTMLRSADGAGVDAVIVADAVTDVFNPNTVRASVGTLFTVPVLETTFEECSAWLGEQGIPLLAATPHTDRCYHDVNLSGPVALAVGSEMHGLPETWMQRAEIQVALPMCGAADSLNVSTSAGILLYETLRQRMQSIDIASEQD
jgi:TrmH family RNA methyltransferase